jgi:hypothetical protein
VAVTFTPQNRCTRGLRRHLVPTGAWLACIGAGLGIVIAAHHATRPALSAVETGLVGRWSTDHGNVDTRLDLRADRTVEVAQRIRLALPGGHVREIGPTVTTGRWRVEGSRLLLETSSRDLALRPWQKLRILVQSQRWPARGERHRVWELQALTRGQFAFIDEGTGEPGVARKEPSLPAAAFASAETDL